MNAHLASVSAARLDAGEALIHLRALGISVRVRVPGGPRGGPPAVFETMNSAGSGPPRWRRAEDEIVHVLSGRFVFELDGRRFLARKGDLVVVPGGVARTYLNVTGTGARQQVTLHPGIDVAAFFRDLAEATDDVDGQRQVDRLRRFASRWGVEFLGPPLTRAALGAGSPAFDF